MAIAPETPPEPKNSAESTIDPDLFDEAGYLEQYPDVAVAVASGRERSGWHHYQRRGRTEGRLGQHVQFDAEYYLRSYPLVAQEIREQRAPDPLSHFIRYGRFRGYLPSPTAPRPANAAALPSPYGGLWPDLPNALDIIQGKQSIGQINADQAERLRFWAENGYVILQQAIPKETIDRAVKDFDAAYSGGMKNLLFECGEVSGGRQAIPWQREINEYASKALDIHHFSTAIRDLIFATEVVEFLGLIFESRTFASQTLGFLRGSAQAGHQDSAYVAYTIPRQFAASWIALEDVTIGAGELFYYPGSHKFRDFIYGGRYKSVHETRRMGNGEFPHEEVRRHVEALVRRAAELGIEKATFAAKKGDALIWHADLVHGGNPVSKFTTRKSVVTHYCPEHLSPLLAEERAIRTYRHNGHTFSTGYYLRSAPGQ